MTVVVDVNPSNGRLIVEDQVEATVEPESRSTVRVPVAAGVGNGEVSLAVSLTSTQGVPIGQTVIIPANVQADWEGVGAAILGAAAAGSSSGGYDDLPTAARCMGGVKDVHFDPDPAHHRRYTEIYQEWLRLHDYLGRGENPVLKRLRSWRNFETP